ncbi:signal peptidase II [Arsenicitalea aurantiaca]|uniref:signal peptidase II n=1 Tax=Arsenicitalea aurantiaca TaxID=1783274 RepID=UPI0013150E44|nr:signal peptidase II [Arsenicitalea aurantiaca]
MTDEARRSATISILVGLLVFGLDRIHKFVQVSADCIEIGATRCVGGDIFARLPMSPTGWTGGEVQQVTGFFDYVLVWNTGISYGLFGSMPVWGLSLIMVAAIVGLSIWWLRGDTTIVRTGLMLIIGGALSNLIDRVIYGAVADFFHFHWQGYSFYIFNIADVAITLGVGFLLLDVLGFGRPRRKPKEA